MLSLNKSEKLVRHFVRLFVKSFVNCLNCPQPRSLYFCIRLQSFVLSRGGLRQSAEVEREAALVEKTGLQEQAVRLSAQLEDVRVRTTTAEATIAQLHEELSAGAAIQGETQSRLVESRAEIERLRGVIDSMSATHETEIDRITGRVLQAEQRYIELEKRTLVDLDRERMAASKLQEQLDSERKGPQADSKSCRARIRQHSSSLRGKARNLGATWPRPNCWRRTRPGGAAGCGSTVQSAELDSQLAAEPALGQRFHVRLDLAGLCLHPLSSSTSLLGTKCFKNIQSLELTNLVPKN